MSQAKCTVVTAVGSDATGLVNGVTECIHEAGANVEDSRMAVLGGEFALMILVGGDADALGRMREGLQGYAQGRALEVFFRDTTRPSGGSGLRYRLKVSGLDHPGIVRHIAASLSRFEANVQAMETHLVPAPMSGAPTFVLSARLTVPPNVPLSKLRTAVANVCDEENLDMVLEADV